VYTGAGGLNNQHDQVEFLLSPRVPHLQKNTSSGSQSERGLFHTKNEPLGTGDFNRLHLICGESNCSQLSTYLKIGTTALIVRLIDAGLCRGNQLLLQSPRCAMHAYAVDPECRAESELYDGRRLTATQIQREYLEMVECNIDAEFMPDWAPQVCERWRRVLDQLESDPVTLSTSLDWAIKYALFQDRVSRSGSSWDQLSVGQGLAAELCEIDTLFGELGPKGLFPTLDRAGGLDHQIPELQSVEDAMTSPPAGGRAEIRGRTIRKLQPNRNRYLCRWDNIKDTRKNRVYDMSDPFGRSPRWRTIERKQSEAIYVDSRARRLFSSGRHEEAVPFSRRLLQIRENSPSADPQLIGSALNNLAHSLVELGEDVEGEALLIRATELRTSYPNPHYWLAQIYRRRGAAGECEGDNRRREVQAWRRYLELGGTSAERQREAEACLAELGT
jgi:hypothetical protein